MEAFYTGLHQPNHAQHFERCMISLGTLATRNSDGTIQRRKDGTLRLRKKPIQCNDVMIDSQAFRILELFGDYPDPVSVYAEALKHICTLCGVTSATAEDYMCETFMLAKTGKDVAEHQALTIERYDELLTHNPPCYILPVLQGYTPAEYLDHIRQYGERLAHGAWVGVGSVCKRNANITAIEEVLMTISLARPDLRLHGFGVKTTALESSIVRSCLYSADSMAWSFAARKGGRNANDWKEAEAFTTKIKHQRVKQRAYQHRMEFV